MIDDALFFTGHRPKDLGNKCYSWDDLDYKLIVRKLTPVVRATVSKYGILKGLVGGALGFDKMAFTILLNLKEEFPDLKIIVCVPFAEQALSWVPPDVQESWRNYKGTLNLREFLEEVIKENTNGASKPWFAKSIEEYYEMLDLADELIFVDEDPEYDMSYLIPVGKFDELKLKNRNAYMASKGKYGIALHNGKSGGTGHCIGVAKTLGRNLIIVNPTNYGITYHNAGGPQ